MTKRQYITVKSEAEMSQIPYSERFKGLIVYVSGSDKYFKLGENISIFKTLLKSDMVHIKATDFINLTLYHGLGTEFVQVICIDEDNGTHLSFAWKTGNGVRSTDMLRDAVTIMSDVKVRDNIHIVITPL